MLRIFRSNHPLVSVLILLVVSGLHCFTFLNPQLSNAEFVNPLSRALVWLLSLSPISLSVTENIFSILIVFAEALFFNHILTKHKMNERGQFTPAFIYAVLSCMFSDFLFLTPSLVSNLFLLIEIDFLFSVYKKEKASSEIFDLGFFISLCSLIYFPSLAFLIFLFAGMLVLRPLRISEWLILLVGAVVPYFLTGVYYFWFDGLPEFFSNITFRKIMNEEFSFVNSAQVILITTVVGVALLWSIVKIQSNYFKTVVQIRNYFVVMLLFSLLGFLSSFMQTSIQPEHFIWLIIPVAMAISYSVQMIKRYWLAELLNISLLLLILYFQFQTRLNFFE